MVNTALREERRHRTDTRPQLVVRPAADAEPPHVSRLAVGLVPVLALVLVAAAVRLPGLHPPALWVDDAAPALVVKAHGLRELLLVGLTYPGFVALLKAWLAVIGFSDTHALLLPFLAGVAAPALLFYVAVKRGAGRFAAFVGGLFLAVSPALVTYSTHVKPYAVEVVAAVVILLTSSRLLDENADARSWSCVLAACVGGTVLSGLVAVVALPAVATVSVAAVRARHTRATIAVAVAVAYVTFLAWWWTAVLRHADRLPLHTVWSGYFIASNDLATTGRALTRTMLLLGGLPPVVTGGFVIAGILCVARRRPVYLGLCLGPLALAMLLAAMGRAPIGTRGNLALLPGLAVLAGIGADAVCAPLRARAGALKPVAAATICLAVLSCGTPFDAYPAEDVKPLLAPMRASAEEQYGVVVSSATGLAFGLYADMPVHFVPTREWFRVRIASPDVYVLPQYELGPAPVSAAIETIESKHTRIWFVVSHAQPGDGGVVDQLRRDGFIPTQTLHSDGATATRYDRRFR